MAHEILLGLAVAAFVISKTLPLWSAFLPNRNLKVTTKVLSLLGEGRSLAEWRIVLRERDEHYRQTLDVHIRHPRVYGDAGMEWIPLSCGCGQSLEALANAWKKVAMSPNLLPGGKELVQRHIRLLDLCSKLV